MFGRSSSRARVGISVASMSVVLIASLTAPTVTPTATAVRGGRVILHMVSRALTGQRVPVSATVTPRRRGRRVVFSARIGGRWKRIGAHRTNAAGRARISHAFDAAGRVAVRAVAAPFHGDRQRTASSTITVVRPASLSVQAPASTGPGAVFDVEIAVSAEQFALHNARVTLVAPADGAQIKPPAGWSVDATTHQASISISNLAAGRTRKLPLRWQAPDTASGLEFTVSLRATAVLPRPATFTQKKRRTVTVDSPTGGGFTFDDNLVTTGQSRMRWTSPSHYYRSCSDKVAQLPVPSFSTTLGEIDDLTADGTRTAAWSELDLAHHPERTDDVAGVAVGAHNPAAALAAVIQGWRDTPNDAAFLNDAATFANALRHPEWAIALETEAAAHDLGGSVGIKNEAVRLSNLGHSYAMWGDFARGATYLKRAVALEPDSVQLNQEYAAISYCTYDYDTANTAYGKSLRPPGTPTEDVTLGNSYPEYTIGAARLWDLSLATAPVVDLIEIPETPADLLGRRDFWTAEAARLSDRLHTLSQQESDLRAQLRAEDMQPASRHQINDLLDHLFADPGVQELASAALDADVPAAFCPYDLSAEFCRGQNDDPDCSRNQQAFDIWHVDISGYREAIGAYVAAAWRNASGVRANLADPIAWQLAGVQTEDVLDSFALGLVDEIMDSVYSMPEYDRDLTPCPWTDTPPTGTAPTPTTVVGADGSPCTANSLAARVSLAVEGEIGTGGEGVGWSIKQSCSSTDYEIDANALPFLAGFLKGSANTDGSGITLFAGVKAAAGGGGQSGSFESSLYLTFDGNGKVADFGWDVGPEAEAGAGPIKIQVYSDHCRISFMSLFSDTPAT